MRSPALLLLGVLGCGGGAPSSPGHPDGAAVEARVLRVGAKNFTEQFILAEILAQRIAAATGARVERVHVAGTALCDEALRAGRIDVYVEYTGTALTAILHKPALRDAAEARRVVAAAYAPARLRWFAPLGFNNTYVIAVREADAAEGRWRTVSDLAAAAGGLRAGFTAEFLERPDGFPGLRERYGLAFKEVRDVDPAIMYAALADARLDVISAFATDGRIQAFGLRPLTDDRGFFPPYEAAPVVREDALAAHPNLAAALAGLADTLDDATMRRLNARVDEAGQDPAAVARAFLSTLSDEATPR